MWMRMKNRHLCNPILLILINTWVLVNTQALHVSIHPKLITTKTNFHISVESSINNTSKNFTLYKFNFGTWQITARRRTVTYRYSTPGKFLIKVSALHNSTWLPWTKTEILVFDHVVVMHSVCSISITTTTVLPEADLSRNSIINARLVNCYGTGNLFIFSKENNRLLRKQDILSLGNFTTDLVVSNSNNCSKLQVFLELKTPKSNISKKQDFPSLQVSKRCQKYSIDLSKSSEINSTSGNSSSESTNNTTSSSKVTSYGTLNPIVAIFFGFVLFIYITDGYLAYQGYKDLLKPVLNLTSEDDDVMYEIRLHIGSGLSTQSPGCEINFTGFGCEGNLGPVHLPGASFQNDGIASFLVSTSREVGDVGTIGIFCKNMDLRSDWYLRKAEILKHSQKPKGCHWGDQDVIVLVSEFECHSWFSPTIKGKSAGQIFSSDMERHERSLALDYITRCQQLFFQKHILTTWKCSFGVNSFTKAQRLSFFFTLWFLLIYSTTFYLIAFGISENSNRKHMFQIGIIRLDKRTMEYAVTNAIFVYVIGIVITLFVATLYGVSDSEEYGNKRGIQIDSTRTYQQHGAVDKPGDIIDKTTGEVGDFKNVEIQYTSNENCLSSYINKGLEFDEHLKRKTEYASVSNGIIRPENRREESFDSTNMEDLGSQANCIEKYHGQENGLQENSILLDICRTDNNSNVPEGFEKHTIENLPEGSVKDVHYNGCSRNLNASMVPDSKVSEIHSDENLYQGGFESKHEELESVQVQLFNRETIPTSRGNALRSCLFKMSGRMFWIAHSVLLLFCILHTIVISTEWSEDLSYHWISMHTISLVVSCFIIDTLRVLGYILSIVLKERQKIKTLTKRTSFEKYIKMIIAAKQAECERSLFCQQEYPEDQMNFLQNYYRISGKFKDLLMFGSFMVLLLILTTWTVNEDSFRFWRSLETFVFHSEELNKIHTNVDNVDPTVNFWSWLNNTLPPLLDTSKRDISLQQLQILGSDVALTQRRVIKGRCDVAAEMVKIMHECNVPYSKKDEDKQFYLSGWKPVLANEVNKTVKNSPWMWQRLHTANDDAGEGYVVMFNSTNVQSTIDNLMKNQWIDQYTREIILQMFVYNPSVNRLASIWIQLDFSTSGYIIITTEFFNFVLFQQHTPGYNIAQIAETAFFVFACYLVYDIFKRKQRTSLSWLKGWLIIQIIVVILSFVIIVMNVFRNYNIYLLAETATATEEKMKYLRSVSSYQGTFYLILANLNLLSLVLLVKPLFTLGLFDDMYIALCRTVSGLKGIALETFLIIIGFACWAHLAFTSNISSFSSMDTTFATLMDMLVRPDNDALYAIRIFGPMLLFVYFCIMILFISNLVISSVEQSYSEARRVFDYVKRKTVLKIFMKKLKKKKRRFEKGLQRYDLTLRSTAGKGKFRTSPRNQTHGPRAVDVEKKEKIIDNETDPTIKFRSSKVNKHREDKPQEEMTTLHDSLLMAVTKIEKLVAKKLLIEHATDKLFVSTVVTEWDKTFLNKPPLDVTSRYKPFIRHQNIAHKNVRK